MTKEEKKAMNNFKEIIENLDEDEQFVYREEIQDYKILLNLIEKQQEEIEELKKHKKHEQEYIDSKVFSAKQLHYIEDNYISKYKIREKIKQYEEYLEIEDWGEKTRLGFNNRIRVLKELLEE